jgi:hypothetical protein
MYCVNLIFNYKVKNGSIASVKTSPEPEFVNVSGAKESIPAAYVAWRVGLITLLVASAGQATKAGGIDS